MKHYTSLWLLLLTAFVIFAVSSAFEMPYWGERQLKSSGIADVLLAEAEDDSDSEAPTVTGVPDTIAEQLDDAFPMPTDTASQTILFIGDSMLEGLGPRLAAYAEHNGHQLYTVIWYSSTSEIWAKSDRLKSYISRIKPTYIFVSIGGNELFVRDIAAKRRKYVEKIIAEIGDIPFVWIGPPNWREDTGINELIARSAPRGTFFLSNGMSFERGADGAHPTRQSAALWLDSVMRWMPQNALHPIRMERPANDSGRANRVFMHKPDDR